MVLKKCFSFSKFPKVFSIFDAGAKPAKSQLKPDAVPSKFAWTETTTTTMMNNTSRHLRALKRQKTAETRIAEAEKSIQDVSHEEEVVSPDSPSGTGMFVQWPLFFLFLLQLHVY